MAKTNKSGLGRGLNSLLGGSFEEAIPEEAPVRDREEVRPAAKTVMRERVVVDPGEIPAYDPILEPRPTVKSVSIEKPKPEVKAAVEEKIDAAVEEIKVKAVDEVPIMQVVPNPDQPRTNFKKEEIEELAASIEKDGVLQPILVRKAGKDTYQIIAGERRWQACRLAGLEKVPIRIKEADDGKALELALIENIQRSDLNPIEEAYGYKRLMERNGMTQAEVAQAMSKGRSTVANALRLLELPEEAQQLLFEEKITAGHARAILSISDPEGRKTLTKKLASEKLSVREAESLARLLSGKKSEDITPRQPMPASYKKAAKALRETLQTNVRVKSSKGKNKIEIEFKDEEDLQRLIEALM